MRVYTVHTPPLRHEGVEAYAERFVFVRDGFRWLAFLFPGFWLLFNRLWLPLLGYIALSLILALVGWATGYGAALWPIGLALSLLIGLEADAIKRWSLERRGWRIEGIVAGRDEVAAEHAFFSRYIDERARAFRPREAARRDAGPFSLFPETR